ncbi:MAG: triose-phosphate isomerase [Elusimicrobia bacterium]|nr:triose-phosphate isomerase [Elusimicrobiota bacterium]
MRKPIVAANWKMNKLKEDVREFVQDFKRKLPHGVLGRVDVVICPSVAHLALFSHEGLLPVGVAAGAQDSHWEDKGAYTGCVSAAMLKDLKVRYAIIGHSERRQHFSESNAMLAGKLRASLRSGLAPIFCVGERLEARDGGQTMNVLGEQMAALSDTPAELLGDPTQLVLAYEPVWAIGTGKVATVEQAQEAHAFLRRQLSTLRGEAWAQDVRILYGGSVTPENFGALIKCPDVDGGLVGGASLEVDKFVKLIEIAAQGA